MSRTSYDGPTVLDALADPEGTAYLAGRCAPTGSSVAAIAAVNVALLSEAGCVDLLVGLEASIAWLTARQQRLLAVLQQRQLGEVDPADPVARTWLREAVGCALRLAPLTAQDRIDTALCLVQRLPDTLSLMESGTLGYRHAVALVDAVDDLDADTTAAVEARVLPRAGDQTPGEFKAAARRAVLVADPATAEDKHQRAVAQRRVVTRPLEDGMSELWALLPAAGAMVVMQAIQALAGATCANDPRNADQRRADALISLGAAVINDPHASRSQGLRPHIQLTVAASTLLGGDNQPGELGGYGPISADTARALAADPTGTWTRILTDASSGVLLDYGTTRYRPPPSLTRHVIARDRECVFPHCHRQAHRCDIDHLTRWTDAGPTAATNLAPLCPRHHHAKDEHHWQLRRDPIAATYEWTSPTGRQYTKIVPRYPTGDTDRDAEFQPNADTDPNRTVDPQDDADPNRTVDPNRTADPSRTVDSKAEAGQNPDAIPVDPDPPPF